MDTENETASENEKYQWRSLILAKLQAYSLQI